MLNIIENNFAEKVGGGICIEKSLYKKNLFYNIFKNNQAKCKIECLKKVMSGGIHLEMAAFSKFDSNYFFNNSAENGRL